MSTPPPPESHLRSVLKGLSWRIIATGTIVLLAWWKTGDVSFALELGAIEFVVKFVLYYLHERAWTTVPLGRVRSLKNRLLNRSASLKQ